jgi:prepilin-type N-terminal cleavage/methylation domain-containing protein
MSIRTTKSSNGFTIAELLIALALMAFLLAAVAFAFNASIMNYRQNEDIFKSVNAARQTLHRITTQLRTAEAVDPNTANNVCSFILADGSTCIAYRYEPGESKLYLDSGGNAYLMCQNVTAMTFTKNTATGEHGLYVENVQISMTVCSGNISHTISASVVIRRNL